MALRSIVLSLVAGVVLAACNSGGRGGGGGGFRDGGAPPGGCADLVGSYDVGFVELEGDCGPQDAVSVDVMAGSCDTSTVMGCTGSRVCSADHCSIAVDARCPTADPMYDVQTRGALTVQSDGARASGELEIQIIDNATGGVFCASTYAAVYTRR